MWRLQFKLELHLPFVHSFLMVHVSSDHRLMYANSRREELGATSLSSSRAA